MPRRKRSQSAGTVDRTSEESRLPPRRRGGQELPDDVQDRPEQNAGYDAAVRGGTRDDDVVRRSVQADVIPEDVGSDDEHIPPAAGNRAAAEIDARAEHNAIKDVRRREHGADVGKI